MKAALIEKISSYVFSALMLVSAIVLVMFYGIGYDNMSQVAGGMVTDPQYTDLLLYWMYALLVICIVCMAIFVVTHFFAQLKGNPKSAIKSLLGIVLIVALFGVAYTFASDAPITINGTAFDDSSILVLTDVCIYVQYVLLFVTVLCTVVSLLGVFKATNKIKA